MRYTLLFVFLLAACAPSASQPSNHPWGDALRALDPADASLPAYDITAVYLRQQNDQLEVRIDLLDFKNPDDIILNIKIMDDSVPEGIILNIDIPDPNTTYRISSDPLLDNVIAVIPRDLLPSHVRVDVSTPEDQVGGITLNGAVPIHRAHLVMTFSDTFAGRFPAEALRSWDGAHSGPRGERHGLKHLLDAIKTYRVPVILLDLNEPENLSALDAMGLLEQIHSLEKEGLLILANEDEDIKIVPLEDATHLYRPFFSNTIYLPLVTESQNNQPGPDGPTIEIRKAILEIALNNDQDDILVLGGSLANTTWGSPDMVGETLAYITSRPYVHVLNEERIRSFPAGHTNTIITQDEIPANEKDQQIESVLGYANSWANTAENEMINQCSKERLKTGYANCILANNTYLAFFDAEEAALTFLFTRDEAGLHQLIGPSWQVAQGLDQYPGGFVVTEGSSKSYESGSEGNELVFRSTDKTRAVTYVLTDAGIGVEYQTEEPLRVEIPLLVDPWIRFSPGWAEKYIQEMSREEIIWGLENGTMVNLQLEGEYTFYTFKDTLGLLQEPEDPDFSYGPGHFIPFPMAIVRAEIRDGHYFRLEGLP